MSSRCWMLVAAIALVGCPPPSNGPGPSLVADPPATTNGKPPGAGVSDLDRGRAYIEKEAWEEALPHLEKAIEADAKNAEAHYYKGVALKFLGKNDEAKASLEKALELDDGIVLAHLHLGELLVTQETPDAINAAKHLEVAVKAEPQQADSRELLGYAYSLLEKWSKAIEHYRAALAIKDKRETRYQLADALMQAGERDAAVEELKKVLPEYADDVAVTIDIAKRFAQSKAYQECVDAFTAAVKVKADDPELYVRRGVCHHELKNEKAARTDYEKAIGVKADYQPAYYYLGQSWLIEQRRKNAAEAFDKAVKLGRDTQFGKKAQGELDAMAVKKKP